MATGFKRSHGHVRAKLDDDEKSMLADLFGEVHELLEDGVAPEQDPLAAMVGISTSVETPSDPALARLLPDGHRDDPDASAELRRYTEQGLRERKRSGLATAIATLRRPGPLRLDDAEARAWLVALTDVRLVLAERMGLRTDEDHDRLVARATGLPDPSVVDLHGAPGADPPGADPPGASTGHPSGDDRDEEGRHARQRLVFMLGLYDFLSWLQETLVETLMRTLPDVPDDAAQP